MGHALAVFVGLLVHGASHAAGLSSDKDDWTDSWLGTLEATLIPSAAIALMLYFGIVHPPAGACVASEHRFPPRTRACGMSIGQARASRSMRRLPLR